MSKNLNQAKLNKKDEFYTRLEDINRVRHYRNHFKNKTICAIVTTQAKQFLSLLLIQF